MAVFVSGYDTEPFIEKIALVNQRGFVYKLWNREIWYHEGFLPSERSKELNIHSSRQSMAMQNPG